MMKNPAKAAYYKEHNVPMLIHSTDYYLYNKKRDLLILEIRYKEKDTFSISIDKDNETVKQIANTHIDWFAQRGIKSYLTVPPGILVGWLGHYYIDIDPTDAIVTEYSKEFEDSEGRSLEPTKYQMLCLWYNTWVEEGGIEKYETHLKEMADPNYEF